MSHPAFNAARFANRPLCCYCGKPVDRDAWDDESQGYFSYGFPCMKDHIDGRFAVVETGPGGDRTVRRFATLKRAQGVAAQYKRDNPHTPEYIWAAVDLGVGTVVECQP